MRKLDQQGGERSVPMRGGSTEWQVSTDRGDTRFELTSEDHIRRMGDGVLIVDAHGIRCRIPDTRALDPRSRKILRTYV